VGSDIEYVALRIGLDCGEGDVAGDGDRQRVAFGAGKRLGVSRPLRTNRNFALVVRQTRLVQGRWDKTSYDPGEECELTVTGQRLGDEPLTLEIEIQEDRGWQRVEVLHAEINSEATEAHARWTIPRKKPQPLPEGAQPSQGAIVEARFEDTDLEMGGTAWVAARFSGLDESMAQFVLERLRPDGSWAEVGRATSTVRDGRARAGLTLASDGKG
jgi:hypothetical protein